MTMQCWINLTTSTCRVPATENFKFVKSKLKKPIKSTCGVLAAEDFKSGKSKLKRLINSSQLPEHAMLLVKYKQSTAWYWWLPDV